MAEIKRLIVFSTGDSANISTWSNVPYLFTETLKKNGIEIRRIQIKEIQFFRYLFLAIKKLIKTLFDIESSYDYSRSSLHFYLSRYLMTKEIRKHQFDAVLILSCSYSPHRINNRPTFLFCDWPYAYYINYFKDRAPDFLERASIQREDSVIENADGIFILFPVVYEYMKKNCDNSGFHYLGNVINSIQEPSDNLINGKRRSQSLLFIGRPHYLEGAVQLVNVFKELKKELPDLQLNIIGMDNSFFKKLPAGVQCHGYLDKGNKEQCQLYYHLLSTASLCVNTNPRWASFSATLEAMYFYTPIITSEYPDFVETFGQELKFGHYFKPNESPPIETLIKAILSATDYSTLCHEAHRSVESFTWDNYVKKVISIMETRTM